jgi:hypothetical protein
MDREQIDALVSQYLDTALSAVEVRLAEDLPLTNNAGCDVLRGQLGEDIERTEQALAIGDYGATMETAHTGCTSGVPAV